jgi:hypothetical protein
VLAAMPSVRRRRVRRVCVWCASHTHRAHTSGFTSTSFVPSQMAAIDPRTVINKTDKKVSCLSCVARECTRVIAVRYRASYDS